MDTLSPLLIGVIALAVAIALGACCMAAVRWLADRRLRRQKMEMADAREALHRQRERVEAKVLQLAS